MSLKYPTLTCVGLFSVLIISCRHEPLVPETIQPPTQSNTCSPDTVYFQQRVLPVFVSNCTQSGCHDVASHKEGIVLNSYQSIMNTGKIVPFQPGSSKAYKKIIEHNNGDRMPPPPTAPLAQAQKDLIYQWIMQGAKNNSCIGNCDSTLFTYSGAIQPLLANYCTGCHNSASAQGGINLSSYTLTKLLVNDGRLWGAITQAQGYSPMPKNGSRLSDCEIAQVKKWIDDGAQNN